MNSNKAKLLLSLIFVSSIVLNMVFAFLKRNDVWPDHFTKLILTVLGIYSVHIAAIFGASSFATGSSRIINLNLLVLAVLLCIIWNALITVRIGMFAFSRDDVSEVITYVNTVSLAGSFLVIGVITAFYSKEANANN